MTNFLRQSVTPEMTEVGKITPPETTTRYLKSEKSPYYEMPGKHKILCREIEFVENNKIIIATYLLESRVALRYIQEIPGHKSSKTAEFTLK